MFLFIFWDPEETPRSSTEFVTEVIKEDLLTQGQLTVELVKEETVASKENQSAVRTVRVSEQVHILDAHRYMGMLRCYIWNKCETH